MVAVIAVHNIGIAVLIEFVSPNDSTKRKIKFVANARDPRSLLLASTLSQEKLVEYAVDKFLKEKWGDRLARASASPESIHIEVIVLE